MAFMRPQIVHGGYWWVETTGGSFLVPDWLVGAEPTAKELSDFCPEMMGVSPWSRDERDQWEFEHREGWYGRLSAPGYLDSTDWSPYDSEEEAIADLADDETDDEV